jgi:hypothetical protein
MLAPEMRGIVAAAVALLAVLGLAPTPAAAQLGEVPLSDVLQVMIIDRELIAIDAVGGGQTTLRLRIGEKVLWTGARGKVGVGLTDQRMLAVTTGSAAWQQLEYQRTERPPTSALLGDRVALMITARRAVGFDGGSGKLVETTLGLRENVLATRAGENVAVVVTDRRAFGMSPFAGGFFETSVLLNERLESVNADSNLATVTTDRRVLIFRAPSGSWEERRRTLH